MSLSPPPPMQSSASPLGQSVAVLMRLVPTIGAEDSLDRAGQALRDGGSPLVAVTRGGELLGAVSQNSLAAALGRGLQPDDSVMEVILLETPVFLPNTSGAEALRLFEQNAHDAALVVDGYGRLMGFVTPADLLPKRYRPPRPPLVGGMATPLGVYLTTGSLRSGPGDLGLVLTGMTLFAMLLVAQFTSIGLARWSAPMGGGIAQWIVTLVPLLLFMVFMRVIPLAGIHGAEHKVVHAIERGEELTRENVRRMPRVHPRCGTNVAVGASIFLWLGTAEWIPDAQLRLLIAGMVTLIFWRPLGSVFQYWVTTREPSERQLEMGIQSGKELLVKYANKRGYAPGILTRIWCSGILHVITGSTILGLLVDLILRALGYEGIGLV